MDEGHITATQLRENIIRYADHLITESELDYDDYSTRIEFHLAAVSTASTGTKENRSLRKEFIKVLKFVLPREFYNTIKDNHYAEHIRNSRDDQRRTE